MEWISIKERLPQEDGSYLVCLDDQSITLGSFYAPMHESISSFLPYSCEESWKPEDVLFWMHLPVAPVNKGSLSVKEESPQNCEKVSECGILYQLAGQYYWLYLPDDEEENEKQNISTVWALGMNEMQEF